MTPRWPASLRRAFSSLQAAKLGSDEARYLHLMQQDPKLSAELLRLGCARQSAQQPDGRITSGWRVQLDAFVKS